MSNYFTDNACTTLLPEVAALTDAGSIESFQGTWLDGAADKIEGK